MREGFVLTLNFALPRQMSRCVISASQLTIASRTKNTGQWSDGPPVFLDVTVWSNSGEAVAKHFKKGDRIYLEGRLSQDEWTDKASQQKRTKIKMVAERWQSLTASKTTSKPPPRRGHKAAGRSLSREHTKTTCRFGKPPPTACESVR